MRENHDAVFCREKAEVLKVRIGIRSQILRLFDEEDGVLKEYSISSSMKGAGEQRGSFMTPRGRHVVRAKIGTGMPVNAVFVGRRPTGEIYSPELAEKFPDRDWILTRILWLSGLEKGFNRLGEVDTMRRYIYIHGCPDGTQMGMPGSHGCIRMRNEDVIDLCDRIETGTEVDILEFL